MKLGWVDFSDDARNRVLDLLTRFEEGVRDELGLGIIRDAFANYFFPGTNTQQTRAKYFFIVPYILKTVVAQTKHKNSFDIWKEIDEKEFKYAKNIYIKSKEIDDNSLMNGLIGKRNLPHNWIARAPSSIYWSGIKKFKICTYDITIDEYIRYTLNQNEEKKKIKALGKDKLSGDGEYDDFDAGDFEYVNFFSIPEISKDFFSKTEASLELTKQEAECLKFQIIETCPASLLAFILRNDIDCNDSFSSLIERIKDMVAPLMQKRMLLAENFSKFAKMIMIRYNKILFENSDERVNQLWDTYQKNLEPMINVDISKIYAEFPRMRDHNGLHRFLIDVQEAFLKNDINEVDRLIYTRECYLKGKSRAKLHTKERGEYAKGIYDLQYRYSNAKRIIKDIYTALRNDHV